MQLDELIENLSVSMSAYRLTVFTRLVIRDASVSLFLQKFRFYQQSRVSVDVCLYFAR